MGSGTPTLRKWWVSVIRFCLRRSLCEDIEPDLFFEDDAFAFFVVVDDSSKFFVSFMVEADLKPEMQAVVDGVEGDGWVGVCVEGFDFFLEEDVKFFW